MRRIIGRHIMACWLSKIWIGFHGIGRNTVSALLFHNQSDNSKIRYFFPQYIECAPAPDMVHRELDCKALRLSTTNMKDYIASKGG